MQLVKDSPRWYIGLSLDSFLFGSPELAINAIIGADLEGYEVNAQGSA
jgi:hypothetical protein